MDLQLRSLMHRLKIIEIELISTQNNLKVFSERRVSIKQWIRTRIIYCY